VTDDWFASPETPELLRKVKIMKNVSLLELASYANPNDEKPKPNPRTS
jgi:hypothetical protein